MQRLRPEVIFLAVAALLPASFIALFFIWPVISLLAVGFSSGHGAISSVGEFNLGYVWEVLTNNNTIRVATQTIVQATAGTLLSVTLGIPAAFVLYRLSFPGQQLLRGAMTVPFVLPSVVVAVAFTSTLGPSGPLYWLGLDQSFIAIVLALAFFNITVVARTVGGLWSRIDPRAEQAARMLGAGPVRVFFSVTLPMLLPSLASAAALVFLFCASSFGIVLVLGGREFATLEIQIYRETVSFLDLRAAAVLSLIQVAIVATVLVAATRLRSRSEQALAMNFTATHVRCARKHVPILGFFFVTVVCIHLVPLASLVMRSFQDRAGDFTTSNYTYLLWPPPNIRLQSTVGEALWLSVKLACMACAISVVCGLAVALVVSRKPRSPILRRGLAAFDSYIMLPLGVSAVTVGFGLLLTMNKPLGIGIDMRTSLWLIPIAQALVALPLVVRAIVPALRGMDPMQREAAAVLGASPLRVMGTLDRAVLQRPLGVAIGFAFAVSLGEFGATSFLVRPGEHTVPVMIGQLIGRQGAENYQMALAASVVLGIFAATVMLAAETLRGDVAGEI